VATARSKDPAHRAPARLPLKVQPVLVYEISQRKPATSWRIWGAALNEQDINEEKQRINQEMAQVRSGAEFPLDILPLAHAQDQDQASAIAKGNHDVILMYHGSGPYSILAALAEPRKWNLMFARHRTGPTCWGYGSVHLRFLRDFVDDFREPGMGLEDVVVDSQAELLRRLRALYGLKNTLGKRIVAVGGPSGVGPVGRYVHAPDRAREVWGLDIVTISYSELGERIKRARQDDALVRRCRDEADKFLAQRGITLDSSTNKDFVARSFFLTEIFKDLMDEQKTDAITINNCMTTIMPVAETTACLPLSLLNDEGYLAFCESDFVVIPSGMLLRYIAGKPVFLNDPTLMHEGVITLAHCTAPRKMDGEHYEDAKILTHNESDYGAAPKVEMRKGQRVTVLDPDFASRRWMGFEGTIIDNPALPMCRTQIDVQYQGDTDRLNQETKGYHWMVAYGNYLWETGYALKKAGVGWLNLSA
jgi:hypothetical protein